MSAQPRHKIWFVDDLKSKLQEFKKEHSADDLEIEIFDDPEQVLKQLAAGGRPDALLIDVFFYPDKTDHYATNSAEEVEKIVTDQIRELRGKWFADERFARGITLMEEIHKKVSNGEISAFPMYAYTTKAPYLLERNAWQRIHNSGAKLLLKNVLAPGDERAIIREDIARYERTWLDRLLAGARDAFHLTNLGRILMTGIVSGTVGFLLGFLLKSALPC